MKRDQQLTLSEIDPAVSHGHDRVVPCMAGYRGRCVCGFVTVELPTKALARGAVSSHLARTPSGQRVVATLRKRHTGAGGA